MRVLTVEAVYQNGVLIPVVDIPLRDKERIRLRIERSPDSTRDESQNAINLRGVWRGHLTAADREEDWVSDTVAAVRRQSGRKVEGLAQDIHEVLPAALQALSVVEART